MIRDNDKQVAKVVITPASVGVGAFTSELIDGTGFGRARFIFVFGANAGTSAALSAGIGVWQGSTSGAAFAAASGASLAAVTSGVLSNNVMVIDTVLTSANPWLQISGGGVLSTAIVSSCVVELYRGVSNPPTHTEQQIVAIG